MIKPRGIIAVVIGLVRVTAQHLGSGVDASQLQAQCVYFDCQVNHLRLLEIDLPVLSLRHNLLVLVPRRCNELAI